MMFFVFIWEYERRKKRAEHDAEYAKSLAELHELN